MALFACSALAACGARTEANIYETAPPVSPERPSPAKPAPGPTMTEDHTVPEPPPKAPTPAVTDSPSDGMHLPECGLPVANCEGITSSVSPDEQGLQVSCVSSTNLGFSAYCTNASCICSRAGISLCECAWAFPGLDALGPNEVGCCFYHAGQ